MNKTRYLQTDSRWSKLPFRNSPDNVGNNGCGMVSICNAIIEMKKYANYTPATMQPYCRQFVVSAGYIIADIPVTMKHYGLTDVKEHATMDSLWKELAKGDRVAVYLMGNRPGGSKKVHWTSGGHFVSSVDYQYKDGDHWVYMKDSASNSSLRNGWMSFKGNLKGDVSRVWSGKLSDAPAPSPSPDPKPTPTGKLVVDGIGGEATVRRMQEFFGTTVDGVIGGQNKNRAPYYPALQAVSFGRGGSRCIVELQKWLDLPNPDGVIGKNTTRAWQRKLINLGYFPKNEVIDGIFGVRSMKAWQECLNNNGGKKGGTPTPTPDPKPTPSKTDLKVIDISEFQDAIDWKKAKADGVKGVIIRCGRRGAGDGILKEDTMYLNHIKGAYSAGIPVGIYMFTQGINAEEGKAEADYAIAQWKKAGVPISFPIAVDTENVFYTEKGKRIAGRANGLSKSKRTTVIKAFCDRIKELGYTPMIYASTSWLDSKLDMSKLPYDVWVAQYYKECQYKGKYIIWQYTSEGSVAGIKGNVDLNHCYIEPKAVNPPSDPKPTPPPTPTKTIDELAQEVLDGKWGNGDERKKRLTEAGYDYNAVQKRVNEIIDASKTIIDKEMDACKVQAAWMKNAAYKWESKPTIPKSKKKGTCVTYVACVLQRIGILKSGQYIWQDGKGYGTGKVYGTNSKMTTTYMKNKTFTACKSKLKKGDIVLCDDNKSGEAGSGGHIMIFSAFNKDGKPLVWDNTCAKTGKRRAYGKSRKILAIVRLK